MDIYHLQQLSDGFGSHDTLDHKYDVLTEITKHFFLEENTQLKNNIKDDLEREYKNLIWIFKQKLNCLESRLRYIVEEKD